MYRHPYPLHVTTTRAREGGPKEYKGQTKMAAWNSFSYICTRALHSFRSFAHCRAASTVIPLLPKATFTPSIQPNLGLPRTRPPKTSATNTILAIRYSSILSTCPNHLNTLWSVLLANSLSVPALLRTSSFLTLSIRDTPTKLLKHFISRTFTFLLSAFLIPHTSAPYNAVGTITPSYKHFLACIPNSLLLRTLFSALQALYPSFILRTTSLSHPPSAATCDPRYLNLSTSSTSLQVHRLVSHAFGPHYHTWRTS